MITVSNLNFGYGKDILFKEVNLKFTPGNCYGLVGANGAGKSTFIKILAKRIEPQLGDVIIGAKQRLAILEQDQFKFDDHNVLDTVIMGHRKLYEVMIERNALYAKAEMSEADGLRAGELESEYAELGGYEAESEVGVLLGGLGVPEALFSKKMKEIDAGYKVRTLLAQALFDNPDILLLDEPTNNLDLKSIKWLTEFLDEFENTVIVVSHDRHFLNQVCTHTADIDFSKIQLYTGNYDFWYQASQLAQSQRRNDKKTRDEKIKDLQAFILRFSANVAKSRQATSRRKLIEKLTIDDLPTSSRRFPFVDFKPERECGKQILTVENLCKSVDGVPIIQNFNLTVNQDDKIAILCHNDLIRTALFEMLGGRVQPDSGTITWGVTIKPAYFPKEHSEYFQNDRNLVDWLRQYSKDQEENYLRGFLGRMLFSGDDAMKKVNVLSGGEKVRCMLSRLMLTGANVLLMDEPTNHLDLEAITAVNEGLIRFSEVVIFAAHDHQFIQTIANRIVELTPGGVIDKRMTFDEYVDSPAIQQIRDSLYHTHLEMTI